MLRFRSSYVETKKALYTLVHRYQPIARSDIADIAGLTRASVSNIVKEFLRLGLVEESDKTGNGVGRKKILLRINDKSIHVIGIDIGRRNIVASIYNAGGKILRTEKRTFPDVRTLSENARDTKDILGRMLAWANSKKIRIDAIGIGVPGPVDPEKGIVRSAPHFRKSEIIDLKGEIENSYKIPTFVEKDVNAAALGEQWFGIGKRYDSFVYLLVVEGMGAGMIVDGHLYRGVHGLAGKIGRFVFPKVDNGEKICILEEFGSEISTLKIAEENAKKSGEGFLYTTMQKRQLNIDDLIEGFKTGDPAALEAVDSMVFYTAITVVNLALFLDPELIIIGGDLAGISPHFVEWVRERVRNILNGHPLPKLRVSPIYDVSISLGAATRAISEAATRKIDSPVFSS